ncbi:MAG: polysaccharide biosynthesis tyrosine autokinase [bacterium]|nr:polysaccharide biosynthesis tyrosine autokinase [bacterium]
MSESAREDRKRNTHLARRPYPLVLGKDLSPSFAESYRTAQTNIHYALNGKFGKLLLVTSSLPQEGKTTTAVNLALTMAEGGQRVLLVDTDLRIPSIYKIFGHDRNRGLTNILMEMYGADLTGGDLSQYGPGDLVSILGIQGKSGLLNISANGDIYHLIFRNGNLVDVQWKNRPVEDRLGSILVESGRITADQQARALKRQVGTQKKLGSILLNMNLISPQEIEGPLKLHLSETLQRVYSLKSGAFYFQDKSLPDDYQILDPHQGGNGFSLFNGIREVAVEKKNTPFIDQRISMYLQNSPVDNLKVLNSGPIPSNPMELLGSRRLSELINILKEKFEVIIFDSPPLNSVSDACILSSRVDGVILVVRVGRTNRRGVKKAKQHLENAGAKICGVILNRLDLRKGGYYYNYYYRYYYSHYQQPKNGSRDGK